MYSSFEPMCDADVSRPGLCQEFFGRRLILFWAQIHRETKGLEGGVSSLGDEGRNYGGVVKFKWGTSDLFPKYLGGLFCS